MIKSVSGKRKKVGVNQQKVLLLLLGGLTLGLCHSPKQSLRVIHEMQKEWKNINRKALNSAINDLYRSKLVATKENRDGTLTLTLSADGNNTALRYNLDTIEIRQPLHWDKKWRVVMFDVPENLKRVRDTLRMHFKKMGFYEFQKSVFVHPHPCKNEIEYIIEFYNARRFIRFIVATDIDNAPALEKHFGLD
jgi:DNA-binding transcriptional regulator PaaX